MFKLPRIVFAALLAPAIYEAQKWSRKNADVADATMAKREGNAALRTCGSILRKAKQLQTPQRHEGSVSTDLYLGFK